MSDRPDKPTRSPREPRPSPINGPAFFVFGIVFLIIGVTQVKALIVPAIAFLLIGMFGIRLQRRYEKAAGIEETLPGKSPERPELLERPESPEHPEERDLPSPPLAPKDDE